MASVKELLRHNLAMKLLALLAAVTVWVSVSMEQQVEAAVEAGVSYVNVFPRLELNPDQADRVTLIVRGPRSGMRQLTRVGLAVEVDLSRLKEPGEQTFDVAESNLDLPAGVRLVRAVPSQLRLSLETRVQQQVNVHPNFVGSPPEGRALVSFTVEPARLTIEGPAGRVSMVQHVTTDPIDLSQVSGAQSFRRTAFLPDPYLRFQGDPEVTVHVLTQ